MTSRRTRTLRADVVGDADQLERELKRAQRAVRDAERTMENFGLTAEDEMGRMERLGLAVQRNWLAVGAALAATEGARRQISAMISAASDLDESVSKVNVVFGESAVEIHEWADGAATSMGLSRQAALETAGTFGNLFTAMGLGQGAASALSKDVVQLGVDFASFNNIGTAEALEKLRAGLVGEAEPLRALGVNISAAAVENKALELGLAATKAELDDNAKVQARWALITEQSKNAAGDFARTQDGLANQTKVLQSNLEDLQADLGRAFVPAMTEATEQANELFEGLEQVADLTSTTFDFVMNVRLTGLEETIGADGEVTVGDVLARMMQGVGVGPGATVRAAVSIPFVDDAFGLLGQGLGAAASVIPQGSQETPFIPRGGPGEELDEPFAGETNAFVRRPGFSAAADEEMAAALDLTVPMNVEQRERERAEERSRGGGRGATAFSPAALAFIDEVVAALPTYELDLSAGGVEDFERVQRAFDDTRASMRTMAAAIGLELADLDARGLEGSAEFAALEEQLGAAHVTESLSRIDLVEDLRLEPFRDEMAELADVLREAEEAAIALAEAERSRAEQNSNMLIRAIMGAGPGTDTSGAEAELIRQQRIAAGLPAAGSAGVNAGGQTVIAVQGDLNVKTMEDGEIPNSVTELLYATP